MTEKKHVDELRATWQWDPVQFIHHEAELLDSRQFEAWLDLFAEDGRYWVPGSRGNATDPGRDVSVVFDDDLSRRQRVMRLMSGKQFAQEPASRTCRILSSERVSRAGGSDRATVHVTTNMVIYESRTDDLNVYPGRCWLTLREGDDGLRIVEKKVVLINVGHYLQNLTFIV